METTVSGVIAVSAVLKGCALAADNYARAYQNTKDVLGMLTWGFLVCSIVDAP